MSDQQFEENIRQICKNDKEGLRSIYEDYGAVIYSVVLEILNNHEDAEDVTSEFFIRLWDVASSYRPGRGHRAWILTIARNMAIDLVRKRGRERLTEEIPNYLQSGEDFPEERLCLGLSLQQALSRLKAEEREIINLKIMGELTFKEIAEFLKKPQGTVAWRYRNAMNKLREVQL